MAHPDLSRRAPARPWCSVSTRHTLRRHPHRAVSILVTLLQIPLATSCASWRMREGPPASVLASVGKPPRARLALTDGRRIALDSVRVVGDSLVGYRGAYAVERVAVPMARVKRIEVSESDLGKTTGLVLFAATVATLAIVGMYSWANQPP